MSALPEKEFAASTGELEDARRFVRLSFSDLGWQTLRNDPSAQASMPPVDASLTFAHPDLGVALVDMAPDRAADPVERLRRRLEALEARPAFAAELPIVYLPLTSADLWRLNIILDSAFASPARLQGGETGWVDVVQQALLPESFPAETKQSDAVATMHAGDTPVPVSRSGFLRPWMLASLAALFLAGAAAIYGFDGPDRQAAPAQTVADAEPAAVPEETVAAPAAPVVGEPIQPAPVPPQPLAEQPPPRAPATTPPPPAVADAPRPRESVTPPKQPEGVSSPKRITVHSLAAGRSSAETLVRAAAGARDELEFRTLRTTLRVAAVRYFHQADKVAAEELARRLGPSWQVQDFMFYRPSPRPGSLEVWLPRTFRAE